MGNFKKLAGKDSPVYHKTKLLLMIYRKLVWRMEDSLYDLGARKDDFGGGRISNLEDFLSIELGDYSSAREKQLMEDRLIGLGESKLMVEIVDKALIKLRSHPENGDIYFNILNDSYISQEKLRDNEIMENHHISQSTYYRHKKKAIDLMGIILWGHILPELRDLWTLGAREDLAGEEEEAYSLES